MRIDHDNYLLKSTVNSNVYFVKSQWITKIYNLQMFCLFEGSILLFLDTILIYCLTRKSCPVSIHTMCNFMANLHTEYTDEPRYLTTSCPCSSSASEGATVRRQMADCRLEWLWLMARKTASSIQVRKLSCSGFTSSSAPFPSWILFRIVKSVQDENFKNLSL